MARHAGPTRRGCRWELTARLSRDQFHLIGLEWHQGLDAVRCIRVERLAGNRRETKHDHLAFYSTENSDVNRIQPTTGFVSVTRNTKAFSTRSSGRSSAFW